MMIKDAIGRCWKWAFREQKSLAARLKRARRSGYDHGGREAKLMLVALGKRCERSQVISWLDRVIKQGRASLVEQGAVDREVDAWEMSCRIMFMVKVSAARRSDCSPLGGPATAATSYSGFR
jgi:hypothetical protein